MKRMVSGVMLTLLLMSMLTLALDIRPTKASGTICIRADGSIDPPTAPIQRNGDTYTLTSNITEGVTIQRNNTTFDGAGYKLQGPRVNNNGIYLFGVNNVTIKRAVINNFRQGIMLSNSSNVALTENVISDNGYNFGIMGYSLSHFVHSIDSSNLINGKPIYYFVNQTGVVINPESYPEVGYLGLINSVNITVERLTLTSNKEGLLLVFTNNSKVTTNNIANNYRGIYLLSSSNNTLSGNNVTANYTDGILFMDSLNITLTGNNITNNVVGILTMDPAGKVPWRPSLNNTISGNNIANNLFGIGLVYLLYSNVVRNNVANNHVGIELHSSSYNSVVANNITANGKGVSLWYSSNNSIFHNNFIHNAPNVDSRESINVWDDDFPSGGNYWSDYNGTDLNQGPYQNETGSDGIGDAPYIINDYNRDRYPLMNPWNLTRIFETPVKIGGREYIIPIETNATLTQIKATSVTLHFWSLGVSGQTYFINITFPQINQTEIKVFINGQKLTPPPFPIITFNGTHYFIYFEFTASTHEVTIQYATTNIATTNLTPSKTIIGTGYTTSINVTVENQGIYTEIFNVTVYANTTIIEIKTNITLTSGNSTDIIFTWNTSGFVKGNYTISAYATPISGETDIEDNNCTGGMVEILWKGDVNKDNVVDGQDIILVIEAIPSYPGYPKWNPYTDINNDNIIDGQDAVLCIDLIPTIYP